MSSSDSSEDNSTLLREAIDSEFINDNMFNNKSIAKLPQQSIIHESLRAKFDEDDQFTTYGVSKEFKQFLANKLSKLLDKQLAESVEIVQNNNLHKKGKLKGIRLFSNSSVYIKKVKETRSNHNQECKLKRSASVDSDIEAKCAQVAVHHQDILDKKDVKNWSTRSKAQVFKYKQLNNGVLSLIQ